MQDAFLRGYLEEAGYGDAAAIAAALPTLREDCQRAKMVTWCDSFGMAGWDVQDKSGEEVDAHVRAVHQGALELRSGAKTKKEIAGLVQEAKANEALPKCAAHKREQEALEAEVQAAKESGSSGASHGVVEKGSETFFIHTATDAMLVLAKAPGCNRVWLEEVAGPPNKDAMWILRSDGRVVHAATGLCLTTPVKYPFTERNCPWDASLTALELAEEVADAAAQLWCHEKSEGGLVIRHVVDGRTVVPNFLEMAAGRGVNANVVDAVSAHRRAHCWGLRSCHSDECGGVCVFALPLCLSLPPSTTLVPIPVGCLLPVSGSRGSTEALDERWLIPVPSSRSVARRSATSAWGCRMAEFVPSTQGCGGPAMCSGGWWELITCSTSRAGSSSAQRRSTLSSPRAQPFDPVVARRGMGQAFLEGNGPTWYLAGGLARSARETVRGTRTATVCTQLRHGKHPLTRKTCATAEGSAKKKKRKKALGTRPREH